MLDLYSAFPNVPFPTTLLCSTCLPIAHTASHLDVSAKGHQTLRSTFPFHVQRPFAEPLPTPAHTATGQQDRRTSDWHQRQHKQQHSLPGESRSPDPLNIYRPPPLTHLQRHAQAPVFQNIFHPKKIHTHTRSLARSHSLTRLLRFSSINTGAHTTAHILPVEGKP